LDHPQHAKKTYRNEESDAYLQSATSWANIDAFYRQYEADSFATAASTLASSTGIANAHLGFAPAQSLIYSISSTEKFRGQPPRFRPRLISIAVDLAKLA